MKNFIILVCLLFIFCIALYPPVKNPRLHHTDWSIDDWIGIMIVSIAIFVGVLGISKLIFEGSP